MPDPETKAVTEDPEPFAITEEPSPAGMGKVLKRSGIDVADIDQAMKMAEHIAKSDIVPPGFKGKPHNVLIAILAGKEVGLLPIQSLQNIAVINNRPGLFGQGCAGVILASNECEYLDIPSTDDVRRDRKATVKAKRRGHPEVIGTFDYNDAKMAGLEGRDTYKKSWPDMYLWRAFHRATKIIFSDLLKGLKPIEVLEDYPEAATVGRPAIPMPQRASEAALPAPAAAPVEEAKDDPKVDALTRNRIYNDWKAAGITDEDALAWMVSNLQISSTADIRESQVSGFKGWIASKVNAIDNSPRQPGQEG